MPQTRNPAASHWRRPSIRSVVTLTLMALASACTSNPALYEPGPETLEADAFVDVDQHQARARRYVDANLTPVEGFSRAQQVAWNLPFTTEAAGHCTDQPEIGLLLVHGLSDSPFVFRDLAKALAAQCVEVRTILLQGHGTRPGDMINAEAEVWRQQVNTHFAALAREVDHAFIGGFSLGGALATEYALSGRNPTPDGLVALAPAWQLNGLRNYLWLAGIADWFVDFVEEEPERNPVKYESVTVNAGVQIGNVLSRTQSLVEQPSPAELPLFLVATEADSVINLTYLTEQFQQRFRHPASRMVVFRDTRQPWPEAWSDSRITALNSYLPEANILEFSHQSLAIAPDNELYGVGGPLQRCLEPNNLTLSACHQLNEDELWFSAWHDDERSAPTSRLTYNPWFDAMAADMASFIRSQSMP